jgi:hypothetical protein
MRRKRANSFSLSWRLPSTMFAGIDIAARMIWLRNATSCDRRIPIATRCACNAKACAFCQTNKFLKSLTPQGEAMRVPDRHHFIRRPTCLSPNAPRKAPSWEAARLTAPCFGIVDLTEAISPLRVAFRLRPPHDAAQSSSLKAQTLLFRGPALSYARDQPPQRELLLRLLRIPSEARSRA